MRVCKRETVEGLNLIYELFTKENFVHQQIKFKERNSQCTYVLLGIGYGYNTTLCMPNCNSEYL